MTMLLSLSLLLSAGKMDPRLVGQWVLNREPFMTLNADGSGVMDDGPLAWSVENNQLVLTDRSTGEADRVSFQLRGEELTISVGGVPLTLKKQGTPAKPEKSAPPAPEAPKPTAKDDQLSQLLISSNWCSMRYSNGNTYTRKVHYDANGTWREGSESDIYISNSNGTAESNARSQSGGQWVVKNGALFVSNPPQTPQLTELPITITRNSNGSPIINAVGREYSMCR